MNFKREIERVKAEVEGLQAEYVEEIILIRKRLDELSKQIRRLEKLYTEVLIAATKIAMERGGEK